METLSYFRRQNQGTKPNRHVFCTAHIDVTYFDDKDFKKKNKKQILN